MCVEHVSEWDLSLANAECLYSIQPHSSSVAFSNVYKICLPNAPQSTNASSYNWKDMHDDFHAFENCEVGLIFSYPSIYTIYFRCATTITILSNRWHCKSRSKLFAQRVLYYDELHVCCEMIQKSGHQFELWLIRFALNKEFDPFSIGWIAGPSANKWMSWLQQQR